MFAVTVFIFTLTVSNLSVHGTFFGGGGGGGGSKGGMSFSGGHIELCQCPHIPAPTRYVAVEVPKPVRVTTIPAPSVQSNMIPVVLPDEDDDGGGRGSKYGRR